MHNKVSTTNQYQVLNKAVNTPVQTTKQQQCSETQNKQIRNGNRTTTQIPENTSYTNSATTNYQTKQCSIKQTRIKTKTQVTVKTQIKVKPIKNQTKTRKSKQENKQNKRTNTNTRTK